MISLRKVSFGATSATLTSVGLISGFAAAHAPRSAVVTALLVATFIDNLVDALGLHVYGEAENFGRRRVLADTLGNFAARLAIGITFVTVVLVLPSAYAVAGSLLSGVVLLTGLTWLVARRRRASPTIEVGKHLATAAVVIIVSTTIGALTLGIRLSAPLDLPLEWQPPRF